MHRNTTVLVRSPAFHRNLWRQLQRKHVGTSWCAGLLGEGACRHRLPVEGRFRGPARDTDEQRERCK